MKSVKPQQPPEGSNRTLTGSRVLFGSVGPALISGAVQAGALSPIDRALYLSVFHHRPFLSAANFVKPFHGALNAVAYRVTSASLYLGLQDVATLTLPPSDCGVCQRALVGVFAGTGNGILLNHLQAIKYQMWTTNQPTTVHTVKFMYSKGGIKSFTNGMAVNVGRDGCFGITYETTRHILKWGNASSSSPFVDALTNCTAAGLGTIISSPLNYARNLKYGTIPGQTVPTVTHLLKELMNSVRQKNTFREKMVLLQARLVLGWGTARVALGMTLGQGIFDLAKRRALQMEEAKREKVHPLSDVLSEEAKRYD